MAIKAKMANNVEFLKAVIARAAEAYLESEIDVIGEENLIGVDGDFETKEAYIIDIIQQWFDDVAKKLTVLPTPDEKVDVEQRRRALDAYKLATSCNNMVPGERLNVGNGIELIKTKNGIIHHINNQLVYVPE